MLFGVLAWYNPSTVLGINIPDIYEEMLPASILVIFLIPVGILLTSFLSERLRGQSEVKTDYTMAKRSLFHLAGSFWISIGSLLLLSCIQTEKYNLTSLVAGSLLLFTWYYICRILIAYVKN